MAEFDFPIGSGLKSTSPKLFVKGVGINVAKTLLFRPPRGITADNEREFDEVEFLDEQSEAISYLGTPVFDQIIIAEGQYFELADTNKTNPIPYDTMILQTVLLEVVQTKNIVTTSLQGRNGTVKEFVSDGDFVITMTGVVTGELDTQGNLQNIGNVYPEVDVKKLIEICKVPDALTVTSTFLQLFGINEVVITAYNINQLEASRDMQPFQVSMLSDVPIELNELASE